MKILKKINRTARHLSNIAARLPVFAAAYTGIRVEPGWICIAEQEGWSISEDAKFVSREFTRHGISSTIVTRPDFIIGNVLHYCSLHTYSLRRRAWAAARNKHVLTCFHGDFGINSQMDGQLRQVLDDKASLDALIVSCSGMQQRFLSWGMPEEKLHLIPLPIDSTIFRPDPAMRETARRALGIPNDSVVIGSFQKDGIGHAEGMDPKMIKGPDIFCETLRRLNRKYPIIALLTGPARGYVKCCLDRAGVRYVHRYAKEIGEVAKYYRALDLYLMTSREEGGPKSVLESLASGTPFVGTEVGMVADIIQDSENGWVCPVGDVDALVQACEAAILDREARARVQIAGQQTIRSFSQHLIGQRYRDLYRKITLSISSSR
jgi:glycosyltransferase involved in cell wall biosynthesis